MGAPLPMELRACILAGYERGDTQEEIAEQCNTTQGTVSRIINRYHREGHVVPGKPGGSHPTITEEEQPIIRTLLKEQPDVTLAQLAEQFAQVVNKPVLSVPTLFRTLKRMNIRRKKKSRQASEQDKPEVKKSGKTTRRPLKKAWKAEKLR